MKLTGETWSPERSISLRITPKQVSCKETTNEKRLEREREREREREQLGFKNREIEREREREKTDDMVFEVGLVAEELGSSM